MISIHDNSVSESLCFKKDAGFWCLLGKIYTVGCIDPLK